MPLAFGILVLAMPRDTPTAARTTALVGTLVTLALSLVVALGFDKSKSGFQFEELGMWIKTFNVHYHLGVDGISLMMLLMTTGIFPFVVGVSLKGITDRVNQFFFWVLLMETAVLGVFLSLDLVLFYVFWEAMLIPMFFIIGIWGGPKRLYATVKFFLYTMVGSMVMLVSIIMIYTTAHSFDLVELQRSLPALLSANKEMVIFIGFLLAFGIKAPIWPFHTWVPDAYAEAPVGGTIILVALKMGLYGFIRFCIPLFPHAMGVAGPFLVALSVIGVVYAAIVAAMQTDLKRLIAYSSISHIGVILLAIFALNSIGISGAVLQMVSHTITTGALFILVGMLYVRRGSYAIADYGGLMKIMPAFAVVFLIATLSSVALPTTSGFAGEILMLVGAFQRYPVQTGIATTSAIWSVVYMLWMYQRVMHGQLDKEENKALPDWNNGEWDPLESTCRHASLSIL